MNPLELTERGFPVFPLNGKIPYAGTQGHLEATTNPDTIAAWQDSRPGCNWGIATGHPTAEGGRLVVVDVDAHHDGFSTLTKVLAQLGQLPRDLVVKTPRGGAHIYLQYPTNHELRSTADLFSDVGPGIDTRAEGGYVVAPGSTLPTGAYEVYKWGAVSTMSAAWLTALTPAARTKDRQPQDHDAPLLEGSRNRSLFEYACKLRNAGANHDEILTAVKSRNLHRVKPPLELPELEHISLNVCDRYPAGERLTTILLDVATEDGLVRIGPQGEESTTTPTAVAQHNAELALSMVMPAAEWFARDDPETPYLIPGVLVEGGLAVLAGEPKTGKSWLLYQMILCIAAGVPMPPYTDIHDPKPAKKVLLIINEGSQAGIKARLVALTRGLGLNPVDVFANISVIVGREFLLAEHKVTLQMAAKEYALICVDVLSGAWFGKENDNDEVKQMIGLLRPAIREGATVLLVHHFGKQGQESGKKRGGQRMRGASALHGAIDSGIYLTRNAGAETTEVELEQKDCSAASTFTFAWPKTQVSASDTCTLQCKVGSAFGEAVKAQSETVRQMAMRFVAADDQLTRSELEDMAQMEGSSKVSMTRTLAQLVDDGALMVSKRKRPNQNGVRKLLDLYSIPSSKRVTGQLIQMFDASQKEEDIDG